MKKIELRSLVIMFAITAIVISVSTYAWFAGNKKVSLSSFDVEITSTNAMLLSMDGKKWDTKINVSKENFERMSYKGHTNTWGEGGLIPVSSSGIIDASSSRMKLYEKIDLTKTSGGYHLVAGQINNTEKESYGYVAFDLFVKNFSKNEYSEVLDILDEEEVYLNYNSHVTSVSNSDVENSVRVGFVQIGRVMESTSNQSKIIGITCDSEAEGVTGICRNAVIWEANDKKHGKEAILKYNTSCKARVDFSIEKESSYKNECAAFENGNTYPTYSINENINFDDNVDIYDGKEYNGYKESLKLTSSSYFTDSMKILPVLDRPMIMSLSPSSITKIRIYIWIELQDIDNYDFSPIGKNISVKFGFDK